MYTLMIIAGFMVLFVILRILKERVLRQAACYKMYAVRDKLVLMVAENKIREDNKVFKYYYDKVNSILSATPKIGADDIVDFILSNKNSSDLERRFKKAQRTVEEMEKLVACESDELKLIISDYYQAGKEMMLAHSSVINMLYVLLWKHGLWPKVYNILSKDLITQARTVDFCDEEAKDFRNLVCARAA